MSVGLIKRKFKENSFVWGLVRGTELICPKALEQGGVAEMLDLIRKSEIKYKYAPTHVLMHVLRNGGLKHVQTKHGFLSDVIQTAPAMAAGQNKVVLGFFQDLFARNKGTQTSDQTLKYEYFGVGSNYGTAVSQSQTTLQAEIFRFVPDEIYDNGLYQITVSTHIKSDEGNPNVTQISNASTPTTSNFSVANVTGIAVGTLIEVEITGDDPEVCRVTAVNGSLITIYALDTGDNLLPVAPSVGDDVYVMYAEGGCFMGNAANASANTGKMANRKLFQYKKTNGAGILIDNQFTYLPTGT